MAMLAEKRSKQKWSEDPRNIAWSRDKARYGYQLLEKMGWADGKGLGSEQNGNTSHVKIKKRKQNLGLGAKEAHDKDWIAHQEDFNNLLSALNQHGGNAELQTEEENKKAMLEVAKASRKRVFYKKFIRSKDTSKYSEKDLACIFGKSANQSAPQNQSDDDSQSDERSTSCPTTPPNSSAESGLITYTSKQNIQEYFARRMKEINEGKGNERTEEKASKGDEDCEESEATPFREKKESKKTKKKKRMETEKECAEEDRPRKMKKRKRKNVDEVNGTNGCSCDEVNDEEASVKLGGHLKEEIETKRKKSKKKKAKKD